MPTNNIDDFRYFLKDSIRKEVAFHLTDQNKGIVPPKPQKPYTSDQQLFDLVGKHEFLEEFNLPFAKAIDQRTSVRQFSDKAMTLKELSFLLWSTQGIREEIGSTATLRTVPSGGARHTFETYLYVRNVEGLEEGIYRYLPLSHQLVFEFTEKELQQKIVHACFGQEFVAGGAVTFFWATLPYRMEWRYHLAAHKVIAMDAGHVCRISTSPVRQSTPVHVPSGHTIRRCWMLSSDWMGMKNS